MSLQRLLSADLVSLPNMNPVSSLSVDLVSLLNMNLVSSLNMNLMGGPTRRDRYSARRPDRPAASRRQGLLSFHEDSTPSCHIYPDHFHCFGCGAHGDRIDWLMQVDGLNREQALELLANWDGPVRSRRSRKTTPGHLPAPCKSGTRPGDRRHAGRRLSHPSWHRPARAGRRHRCSVAVSSALPVSALAPVGPAWSRCCAMSRPIAWPASIALGFLRHGSPASRSSGSCWSLAGPRRGQALAGHKRPSGR